jgi:hypothetical protein
MDAASNTATMMDAVVGGTFRQLMRGSWQSRPRNFAVAGIEPTATVLRPVIEE